MSSSLYSRSFCDVEAVVVVVEEEEKEASEPGWGCSMNGEVCLLSSMCRKLEAERRMKEGGGGGGLPRPPLAVSYVVSKGGGGGVGWSRDGERRFPARAGHPRERTCSSFLFSTALGSRQEHSSRMSQDMGKGIT